MKVSHQMNRPRGSNSYTNSVSSNQKTHKQKQMQGKESYSPNFFKGVRQMPNFSNSAMEDQSLIPDHSQSSLYDKKQQTSPDRVMMPRSRPPSIATSNVDGSRHKSKFQEQIEESSQLSSTTEFDNQIEVLNSFLGMKELQEQNQEWEKVPEIVHLTLKAVRNSLVTLGEKVIESKVILNDQGIKIKSNQMEIEKLRHSTNSDGVTKNQKYQNSHYQSRMAGLDSTMIEEVKMIADALFTKKSEQIEKAIEEMHADFESGLEEVSKELNSLNFLKENLKKNENLTDQRFNKIQEELSKLFNSGQRSQQIQAKVDNLTRQMYSEKQGLSQVEEYLQENYFTKGQMEKLLNKVRNASNIQTESEDECYTQSVEVTRTKKFNDFKKTTKAGKKQRKSSKTPKKSSKPKSNAAYLQLHQNQKNTKGDVLSKELHEFKVKVQRDISQMATLQEVQEIVLKFQNQTMSKYKKVNQNLHKLQKTVKERTFVTNQSKDVEHISPSRGKDCMKPSPSMYSKIGVTAQYQAYMRKGNKNKQLKGQTSKKDVSSCSSKSGGLSMKKNKNHRSDSRKNLDSGSNSPHNHAQKHHHKTPNLGNSHHKQSSYAAQSKTDRQIGYEQSSSLKKEPISSFYIGSSPSEIVESHNSKKQTNPLIRRTEKELNRKLSELKVQLQEQILNSLKSIETKFQNRLSHSEKEFCSIVEENWATVKKDSMDRTEKESIKRSLATLALHNIIACYSTEQNCEKHSIIEWTKQHGNTMRQNFSLSNFKHSPSSYVMVNSPGIYRIEVRFFSQVEKQINYQILLNEECIFQVIKSKRREADSLLNNEAKSQIYSPVEGEASDLLERNDSRVQPRTNNNVRLHFCRGVGFSETLLVPPKTKISIRMLEKFEMGQGFIWICKL